MRRRSLADHVGARVGRLGRRVGVEQTYLTLREGRPADLLGLLTRASADAITVTPVTHTRDGSRPGCLSAATRAASSSSPRRSR